MPMLRAVPFDLKHRAFDVDGVEILHFQFGDFEQYDGTSK